MLNEKLFQGLNAQLSELIASGPARDLEKNARALLSGFFSRLDLVTREEFDAQTKVLERTRAKAEALEVRLAELERSVAGSSAAAAPGPAGGSTLAGDAAAATFTGPTAGASGSS